MNINNEVYDKMAHYWWDEEKCGTLATIRHFVNSVRVKYFQKILNTNYNYEFKNHSLLDIGCGGGFLTEEFTEAGFKVTGIDPSLESIKAARKHSKINNLSINYFHGYGEKLPFKPHSFSIVSCCDVFEHVTNLNKVIEEISRVLLPGGILLFDSINRTLKSKIIIKATQEWKSTSFMEPNVHVWNMFIKPKELIGIFSNHNLNIIELKGMSPNFNIISHYINLRKCKKGEITFKQLGEKLNFRITGNISGSYIGFAVKST